MKNGCSREGGQKGGPALAWREEASFCLDFFLSFCGNDKKKKRDVSSGVELHKFNEFNSSPLY